MAAVVKGREKAYCLKKFGSWSRIETYESEGGTAPFFIYKQFVPGKAIMGNLIQLRGYQLVISFLPTYHDGRYEKVVSKIGPFSLLDYLESWLLSFVDCFQAEFVQEGSIVSCPISSVEKEPFDPRDVVLYPDDPLLMAKDAVDMLVHFGRHFLTDSDKPFLWTATIRLRMETGIYPMDAFVVSGPFEAQEEIPGWCVQFFQSLRAKASEVKNVECKITDEGIISESQHEFGRDDEYVLNARNDPEEEAREFFCEVIRDLIATCNVRI